MHDVNGTAIRVLIAKAGLDGHDRGALIVAQGLREAGMEVFFSGIRKTPSQIADMAVKFRVECLGLSSHAGTHLVHFPKVVQQLRQRNAHRMLLIGGGIIPEEHIPLLMRAGYSGIFTPGSSVQEIVEFIQGRVKEMRGEKRAVRSL